MTPENDSPAAAVTICGNLSGFAAAWSKWFPTIEGAAAELSGRMLDLGGVVPGQAVLDVGTGAGEPALAAARGVGDTGRVLGIDLSADMLATASDRLRESGLGNVEFEEMSADALDLPAAHFDTILCRWSLMFVQDVGRTLTELCTALKPGGKLVAAVWGAPEDVPTISLATQVIYDTLDLGPPHVGAGSAFALSDIDAFAADCRNAGFANVAHETFDVAYGFSSAADYVEYRTDCASWLYDVMADSPPEAQEAAWQAVADAADTFATADGTLRMVNQAVLVSGERPA